jgi:RNA polymerase sigma-70 factor, ECF subfamily
VAELEPDDRLVRRFLDGDPSAFTTLVQRHETRVYNLCLRMLSNPEDALDATQETFVTALRKLGQFRGEAQFTTWLHRVAVNACYDELRRQRRRPVLHSIPHDDEGERTREQGPPVIDHADAVAGTLDAGAALAQVPEDFRIALVLADVQDLPYEDIARILDVPVGTVKSRVHRGRVALARAMSIAGEPTPRSATSKKEP